MIMRCLSRIPLPKSLRWQFMLALSAPALLIMAGTLTAAYDLHISSRATRQLAEARLVRLQQAQDLVQCTLLIERETYRMLTADSLDSMQASYREIVQRLDLMDSLVLRLGQASNDISVLALDQAGQLFRNTFHIVAQLRRNLLAGALPIPEVAGQRATLLRFHGELQRQTLSLVDATRDLSARFTRDYQESMRQHTETLEQHQWRMMTLMAGSILLAWLVSRYFLSRRVVLRLQQISDRLRLDEASAASLRMPVQGDDEIGDMARAVGRFIEDRRLLALAQRDLKKNEEMLRRRLELEQVLAVVSSRLIGMRFEEIEKELPPLLGIVAGSIGADTARVCGMDAGVVTRLSAWSTGEAPQEEGLCPGMESRAYAWFISKLQAFERIVIRKPEDLPAEAASGRDSLAEKGIRSLLAVPMVKGNTLIGCLAFLSRKALRDWGAEDVSLVDTVARILANAIETARLERALRYNERRYFDLIDNLTEGLWSVDREGRTTFVNRSMAGMLGYEPEDILGTEPRFFLTDEEARNLGRRLEESRQGITYKHTMEFIHKDGHRVYVTVSGTPVCNEQGAVVGSMALVSDLSKERLLQLQLIQAQRLEAIGQLAAGIAHEINTPTQYVDNNTQFLRGAFEGMLAVLRAYDGLLQEARGAPALAEAVQRVEAAKQDQRIDSLLEDIPGAFDDASDGLQRISLIVDSVKRFAHPGQGEMTRADLNDALRSTIVVARNEWKYVAEVVNELDPNLPPVPCVLTDINQVVLNLIVNAAHAIASARGEDSAPKGVITIRTRAEKGWAIIEVQDTGPGIPLAIRSRIFDPFFTTKEVGKGTGQGLAIARTVVVEKHHGTIHFETEDGKGTTFFVHLPLNPSKGKDEQ